MAEAAGSVADLFGGASALGSSVSSFVSTYFSDAERLDMISAQVSGVFDDLGVSMPNTAQAFRELVLSQDLMTESGREAYASLMGVADGFAAINGGISALDQSFDSSGWYASEFESRLAQAASARGYSVETIVAQSAGTTQIGRTSLSAADGASVQLLTRMARVLESLEADGFKTYEGV